MKQPVREAAPSPLARFKRAETYRSAAFMAAVVGSLLLYFGLAEQSLWAFVGFIIMFLGAAIAIVAVVLGIRDKSVHEIVLGLVLLMWLVLLPLIMLSRQLSQIEVPVQPAAEQVKAAASEAVAQ